MVKNMTKISKIEALYMPAPPIALPFRACEYCEFFITENPPKIPVNDCSKVDKNTPPDQGFIGSFATCRLWATKSGAPAIASKSNINETSLF